MKRHNLTMALATFVLSASAWAAPPDTEAVEFYNVNLNHYFITATASDAAFIEAGGAGPGWVRTGRSFQAWQKQVDAPADAQPVCRFYSSIANSHFYTANAGECSWLRSGNYGWQYEGVAFHVQPPQNGQCPSGTVALQRIYNNGYASGEGSNHRYVDDAPLAQLMVGSGWIVEGTAFCAAAKATGTNANLPATTSAFQSLAGTWAGNGKWELETSTSETRKRGLLQLTATEDGQFTGTGNGCTFTGQVTRGNDFRSLFTGTATAAGCSDAAFNGHYEVKLERYGRPVLKAKLEREDAEVEASVEAVLILDRQPPVGPSPGVAQGEWSGTVSWEAESDGTEVHANKLLELAVSSSGAITGRGFGCTFSGTLGGDLMAAGCEQAIFNGAYRAKLKPEGPGRLEVELERESGGTEVEISGVLVAKDAGTGVTPPEPQDSSLVGSWSGPLSWSAGGARGSGTLVFTLDAAGAFTGTAAGCTLAGTVVLSHHGRSVASGSVEASGCTEPALNGTFTHIEMEREGHGVFEIELERDHGVEVKLKAKVRRTG